MGIKHPLMAAGFLLSVASLNVHATLTSYSANGVDLVRMQGGGFDVSFTKDGNLLGTLETTMGYNNAINAIIAASPTINDTANGYDTPANSGHHTVTAADFGSNGLVDWFGAQAFVGYLNSISYGGGSLWSLPGVTDTGAPGCDFAYSGTDCGWNVDTNTDPLAQLYFNELGKTSAIGTSGQTQSGYGIFSNNGGQVPSGAIGPFSNVQSYPYWSDTEYTPDSAWLFFANVGGQNWNPKASQFYAWAVIPGQIVATPIPAAAWLFGPALLSLIGFSKRGGRDRMMKS